LKRDAAVVVEKVQEGREGRGYASTVGGKRQAASDDPIDRRNIKNCRQNSPAGSMVAE